MKYKMLLLQVDLNQQSLASPTLSGKTNNYEYKQAIIIPHDECSSGNPQKDSERSKKVSHNGINGICYEKSNKQKLAPNTMLQRENMVIKDKRRQYHKNKKTAI